MIALAITAALIIQTYDGQTRVVEHLSDGGCDAARCLAQYGHSCIAEAVEGVRRERSRIEEGLYDQAHPMVCDAKTGVCHRSGEGERFNIIPGWSAQAVPSGATKTAMCVK